MSSIAICFSGQARAFHHTALNLECYLVKQLQSYGHSVSVFAHIAEDQYSKNWDVLADFGCPVQVLVEPDLVLDMSGVKHLQRTGTALPLLLMHRSWSKANQLMIDSRKQFDIVVRTRLDIKFFSPVADLAQFNVVNCIYVPDFHNFPMVQPQHGGVNDRFAFGNMSNITLYTNLAKRTQFYQQRGHVFHAESTLSHHLREMGVRVERVPIRFTRVRDTGEELDNRLREPRETWAEIDK
jgi:hypothetical protein